MAESFYPFALNNKTNLNEFYIFAGRLVIFTIILTRRNELFLGSILLTLINDH